MVSVLEKSGHRGFVVWFTGLSGAGKTTLAKALQKRFLEEDIYVKHLDGDDLRKGLNKDLGFTEEERFENIRRAAEVARLFSEGGITTFCTFITPMEKMRELARSIIERPWYIEVFVDCSLEKCEERDVKGLYKKARTGETKYFTGISAGFETPLNPDIVMNTEVSDPGACVEQIFQSLAGLFYPKEAIVKQ
jgi:adenylyl-sulfate kinase